MLLLLLPLQLLPQKRSENKGSTMSSTKQHQEQLQQQQSLIEHPNTCLRLCLSPRVVSRIKSKVQNIPKTFQNLQKHSNFKNTAKHSKKTEAKPKRPKMSKMPN